MCVCVCVCVCLSKDAAKIINKIKICNASTSTYVNKLFLGGPRSVMVNAVGNGHGDTSSNPGRD